MARLKQLHPGNYRTGDRIGDEFESIIRYIVAAEKGNKTLSELMTILFDEDGEWRGPVELRLDNIQGLQYRVGTYDNAEAGWLNLATIASLRGPSGSSVGTIEGPLFFNRSDQTATNLQTNFPYGFTDDAVDVFVYVNGILEATANYTKDTINNEIVFGTGLAAGDKVTILSVRDNPASTYRRSDIVSAGQAVFPFVHDESEQLLVFRNGLVQRPGGSNDYTSSASTDTITFTTTIPPGDVVTVITAQNDFLRSVGGIMLEDNYTNGNGLIPFSKLAIENDEIPQGKINGLTTLLANRGRIYVSATTPAAPSSGDLWVDTSQAPNVLKFFNGVQWLATSSEIDLPPFSVSQAGFVLHVNGTGNGLIWQAVDLSNVIPLSQKAAVNGVASLDGNGRVPLTQMPTTFALGDFYKIQSGAISNTTYTVARIYKRKIRIDGIARILSSGSCDVEITVDGVVVGPSPALGVTTSMQHGNLSPAIEVDATAAPKTIGIKVTNNSSGNDLEVVLAYAAVTV